MPILDQKGTCAGRFARRTVRTSILRPKARPVPSGYPSLRCVPFRWAQPRPRCDDERRGARGTGPCSRVTLHARGMHIATRLRLNAPNRHRGDAAHRRLPPCATVAQRLRRGEAVPNVDCPTRASSVRCGFHAAPGTAGTPRVSSRTSLAHPLAHARHRPAPGSAASISSAMRPISGFLHARASSPPASRCECRS